MCGLITACLFLPKFSFASSFILSSSQTQLGPNDEYNVSVSLSISAANGTTYYLRGAFYQSGTANYCGLTWNGTSYYNGPYTTNNGWTNLLPITVQNSSWSGTLKAKLDTTDSGCQSSGTYNFRIQRYTSSGTGNFDGQNEQTVIVVISTPTPTPSPTVIPPTSTPLPTKKPTVVTVLPTAKATLNPTISTSLSPIIGASSDGVVLGSSTSGLTEVDGIKDKKEQGMNVVALVCIIGGILLLSTCGILFFWKKDILSFLQKHDATNE